MYASYWEDDKWYWLVIIDNLYPCLSPDATDGYYCLQSWYFFCATRLLNCLSLDIKSLRESCSEHESRRMTCCEADNLFLTVDATKMFKIITYLATKTIRMCIETRDSELKITACYLSFSNPNTITTDKIKMDEYRIYSTSSQKLMRLLFKGSH